MRGQRRRVAALTTLSMTALTLGSTAFGPASAALADPPPLPVTLPVTPPTATPLLEALGTTPAPASGSDGGVIAMTPNGRFVVFDYRSRGADANGNFIPTPARVGIVRPGRPSPRWFRPEPTDPAQFRRVTGGDATGGWVVWREEPFPGTPADVVLVAHHLRSRLTKELVRTTALVEKPRILGGRAYWEQRNTQTGAPAVWSVALTGGTPRQDVAGGSDVAVDRCGTARALFYATTSADGTTAEVHRRKVRRGALGPDTTVLTRTFAGPNTQVLGLAACRGAVALSSGRPYPGGLPGWVQGRILLRNADGTGVEFALPNDRVSREVVLSERLLGYLSTEIGPWGSQQQAVVDRATNDAFPLGDMPSGSYSPQSGLVAFAADDVVAWNTIGFTAGWMFSQGMAARYLGAPGAP